MLTKLSLFYSLIFCLSIVCCLSSKVKLGVFFESLCPDSRRFFIDQLNPTLTTYGDLFDVELVPFGNSKWTYNTTTRDVLFECQHGDLECFGNRIQSCLIRKAENNTGLSVGFISCMFSSHKWKKPDISGKNCSHQFGIDWSALYDCSTGPYSTILQLEMYNKTNSLKPPHNWIPWITIDGKHSDQIQYFAETDLSKLICDQYKDHKPTQCQQKALRDAKYESYPLNRYISKDGVIEP